MARKTVRSMTDLLVKLVKDSSDKCIVMTMTDFLLKYESTHTPNDKFFTTLTKELLTRNIVLGVGHRVVVICKDE